MILVSASLLFLILSYDGSSVQPAGGTAAPDPCVNSGQKPKLKRNKTKSSGAILHLQHDYSRGFALVWSKSCGLACHSLPTQLLFINL
ncbi:hypothetical protein HDV62DRAFT_197063 [Trichoderma sp. SZMC 28011]